MPIFYFYNLASARLTHFFLFYNKNLRFRTLFESVKMAPKKIKGKKKDSDDGKTEGDRDVDRDQQLKDE